MDARYEKLFNVYIEHTYFDNARFTGYTILPVPESRSLFLKYGLLLKSQQDGFHILFADFFEGKKRTRKSVLAEISSLQFSFQLTDTAFYNYTGNLPDHTDKTIFWFSNFDKELQTHRASNLLHLNGFVGESEIIPSPDSLHFSGYIEIRFDANLKEEFYIRFLNRSTFWRYIITDSHLQKFEKLAILNTANQNQFSAPEIIELPDGRKGFAFTSVEPIELTQQNKNNFRLVANHDEMANHAEKILIPQLPGPSLLTNFELSDGNKISEIFVN